jgi:hypothetical protein
MRTFPCYMPNNDEQAAIGIVAEDLKEGISWERMSLPECKG